MLVYTVYNDIPSDLVLLLKYIANNSIGRCTVGLADVISAIATVIEYHY